MIHPVLSPSLDAQLLTEERVAWIWNVSPRTVREWREQGRLSCVKVGKNLVRYQPADVLANILAYYRRSKDAPVVVGVGPQDILWSRIERLIETAVESRVGRYLETP